MDCSSVSMQKEECVCVCVWWVSVLYRDMGYGVTSWDSVSALLILC